MSLSLTAARGAATLLKTMARWPSEVVDGPSIAVVVAHPDDETIGCGATLRRLKGVSIVETTNGAPSRSEFWRPKGFESAEAYTSARRQGLEMALSMVDIPADRISNFGSADQEMVFGLVALTQWLKNWLCERSIDLVLTQAYEGGHPDHDATAFAVHAATQLIQREYGKTLTIVEMPFYRLSPSGPLVQEFDNSTNEDVFEIRLRDEDVKLKQRMFEAHASQTATLRRFGTEIERFRIAPRYDFSELPNRGNVLYESRNWMVKGAQWLHLSRTALRDLALRHYAPVANGWDNRLLPRRLPRQAGTVALALSPKSSIERVATARQVLTH